MAMTTEFISARDMNIGVPREYELPESNFGDLYTVAAIKLLEALPASSADLVFLDPPFNLGKDYSAGSSDLDSKSPEEYEEWMKEILLLSSKALVDGGSLYLYHLPEWAMRLGAFIYQHLQFRHWIAISMKNGFVRGENLYPAHYALLYFTKGDPKYFRRPKLQPKRCRSCGNTVKDYGGYLNIVEEKGLNLSDFWEDLSPVRHSNRKLRSENQLPVKLLDRIVEISGPPGGLFVDPFAGTGTGLVAAMNHQMSFIGGDIVSSNSEIIHSRISQMLVGEKL